MTTNFNADFFSGNRQRLRKQLGLSKQEVIIVPAHTKVQKSHDEAYEFVQDSNFFYLTGITEPDCLLVMTADTELLLSPSISAHLQLWEGQVGLESLGQTSGIREVLAGRAASQTLQRLVANASSVYTPLPYDGHILRTYYRMVANPARANLIRKLKSVSSGIVIQDLRPALSRLRMIKQPQEVEAIEQAITITTGAIEAVRQQLLELHTEHEVKALLEYEFLRRGADGTGFDSIVASGANTTQIHYMQASKAPLDRKLVLLDVGARIHGYTADISRVICESEFTPRQKQIYEAVSDLQDYAFSLLKPGLQIADYEDMVDQKSSELTEGLRVSKHKTARRGKRVIPHAVSHHLGLDAHDAADYKAPLEPNMVLAVEPGIYLPEEGIGMRIEDNVLITKDGFINMSAKLPRSL